MANNNDNKILNVPPLRFPEFSGEWKKVRLGEECNMLCGYAFNGEDIVEQGSYLLMRGINITEGSIRHSSELDRYYSGSIEKLDKYKLAVGDLVIGMDGSKVGRNSAIVSSYEDGSYLVQRVCRIKSSIGNNYILQLINNTKFHQYVDTVKTSSAIPHISLGDIQNFRISIPPTQDETDKIAKLFLLLDERIATQNKIIERYESLIRGIAQHCIKESTSGKTYVKLGDICQITTGKLDANAQVDNGIYPFFTCAEQPFKINSFAFDTEALLISGNGANLGYINYYKGKFNAYQRTYVLDLFSENIQYIKWALKVLLPKRIAIEKSSSNTPYIVLSTLTDLRLPIPCKSKQGFIANLMQSLERKLSNQIAQYDSYNYLKQYLLRQMFI